MAESLSISDDASQADLKDYSCDLLEIQANRVAKIQERLAKMSLAEYMVDELTNAEEALLKSCARHVQMRGHNLDCLGARLDIMTALIEYKHHGSAISDQLDTREPAKETPQSLDLAA